MNTNGLAMRSDKSARRASVAIQASHASVTQLVSSFMKSAFTVFIAVILTSCTHVTQQNQENALDGDLRRLQGDWTIDSETIDGQKQPDEIRRTTMTYTGHHWIQRKDGVITSEGSSEFRPDTNPKEIDISPLGGPAAGKVVPGIYRLSGDTYESCFVLPGKERPTQFSSKQGSGHFYVIFKRAHNHGK